MIKIHATKMHAKLFTSLYEEMIDEYSNNPLAEVFAFYI